MTRLKIVSILLLISHISLAQLTGYVFIDTNENGIKDPNEKTLSGAILSDGYNVTKTGNDGKFILPGWDKQRFVTLYTGANFTCKNRYFPIGETTDEYIFALSPKPNNGQVNFVHISDTETFEYRDWVDQLKQYAKVHKPHFIIHTGDICYKAGMDWHSKHLTTSQIGVPVYYCLGNHDLIEGDYGEQFFEACFGPAWYAFEEGNTLFVITPMMGGDYKPGFSREDIGGWLKNLLNAYDKEQSKVFFNHNLLSNTDKFEFKVNNEKTIALENYNMKAWLYGHWHTNMVKKHGNSQIISYGTSTLVKGGIDHSPSGFRVVNVDINGDTKSHFRWTYLNREIEIIEPHKNSAEITQDGMVRVSVNTYHSGAATDSVKFSVWGTEGFSWKTSMDYSNWKHMHQNSDWNWSASFHPKNQEKLEIVVYSYLSSGEVLKARKKVNLLKQEESVTENGKWYNLAGNMEHDPVTNKNHSLPYKFGWSANLGSNIHMSSPVVHKNSVISSCFDDGNADNCFIVCFNASTGEEKWRYKTINSVKNQMVIAAESVIATDMQGFTYALNIESGEVIWKKDLEHNKLPGFVSGIVTDGEIVYTGFGKSLCALDAKTGEEIWRNTQWSGGEGTTPTMTIADDVLIVSKHWGAIYAHNISSGKLLWSRNDDGLRFRNGVLSYKEGSLWLAERSGSGDGKLHKIDIKTGKTVHSFLTKMSNSGTSAPLVHNDKIIIAGSHPGISAFNKLTGKKVWHLNIGKAMIYTPPYFCDEQRTIEATPLLIGNKIVFGGMDGKLYVLDEENGNILWQTYLGAPILTSVAVTNDRIYVCDFAGNIYCFRST